MPHAQDSLSLYPEAFDEYYEDEGEEGDFDEQHASPVTSEDYDAELEMLVNAYLRDMNYTTVNQAALNVAYSTINAGLIALPFVAQEAGIPMFIGVMIIVSIISGYTSSMVIAMANEQKVRTLEDLAECAFGVRGFFLVSSFQILFSFSLICITLDVWADIMSDVFNELSVIHSFWLETHRGQVLLGSLLIFPLCLYKTSLSKMKWTSYVTVFAVISALLAVVATYFTDKNISNNIFTESNATELVSPKTEWWAIVFIAVFCFSCNQKTLVIYGSLRRRSSERWNVALNRANIVVTILYLIFGITGFISKVRKDLTLDNFNFFLDNSDENKNVYDPARAVVAFSLLLTIPVDCLVATTTWRRLLSKYYRLQKQKYRSLNQGNPTDQGKGTDPSSSQSVSLKKNRRKKNRAQRRRRIEDSQSASGSISNWSLYKSLLSFYPPPPSVFQEETVVRKPTSSISKERTTDSLSVSQMDDETLILSLKKEAAEEDLEHTLLLHPNEIQKTLGVDESPNKLSKVIEEDVEEEYLEEEYDPEDQWCLSCFPDREQILPTIVVWVFAVGICLLVQHWLYLAGTIATVSMVMLTFIFPSMLYFRLGLLVDYQAIPIISDIIPNRAYMLLTQMIGIAILVFDLLLILCVVATNANIARNEA